MLGNAVLPINIPRIQPEILAIEAYIIYFQDISKSLYPKARYYFVNEKIIES